MNKRVEEFLAKNSLGNSDNNREAILLQAGLYDEITEYDPNSCTYKFVGRKPIKVTDIEFEAIKKCLSAKEIAKSNTIANIITIAAYSVLILGFIIGVLVGTELSGYGSDFNAPLALIVWCIGAVCGISMLWFAEVLKLLQSIKNQFSNID